MLPDECWAVGVVALLFYLRHKMSHSSATSLSMRRDFPCMWDGLALSILALYWMVFLIASPAPMSLSLVDDAYIFQRVVDNLLAGNGWTYNLSDVTNPITAPLYVFLLAGAKVFGISAPLTISGTYLFGLFLLGVGLYFGFLPAHGRSVSLTIAILVSSAAIPVSSWGMETSLFLACITFAVLAFDCGFMRLAGMFCALASLCRPEGVALIGILFFCHIWAHKRAPWGMVFVFLLVLTPWLLYSYLVHGYVLPNSVAVKAIQRNIGWFKTQPPWLLYFLAQPKWPWLTYSLAIWGLFRMIGASKQNRFLTLIVMFSAVQVAAYSVKGAPAGYFWYLAPGNMAVDCLVALGLFSLLRTAMSRFSGALKSERAVTGFTCLLVMVVMSKIGTAPMTLIKPYRLGAEYRKAGEWIGAHTPVSDVVAATEIGYIGYFSHREIRDIHGLIHPKALPFLKREEWDWWLKVSPPQVVVTHEPAWDGEPSDHAGWSPEKLANFRARYAKVATFGQVCVYRALPFNP